MSIGFKIAALVVFIFTVPDVRLLLYLASVGPVHVDSPWRVIINSLLALVSGVYLYRSLRALKTSDAP